MQKVKKINTVTLQKADNKNKQFIITVRPKANGFEARMTLKVVGGGKNPRLTSNGSSENEAVYRILIKIKGKIIEYKKMRLLTTDTSLKIYNSLISSMNILKIKDENILQEIPSILQILSSNDIQEEIVTNNEVDIISLSKDNIQKSKDFKTVALEWFSHKVSLTKLSDENVKPLSGKTLEGYNYIVINRLIPYFESNTNITLITENDIKTLIQSLNGKRAKEDTYFVIKMIFDYSKEKKYILELPDIKKPKRPFSDIEESDIYIESDRHELWLDTFEQENTDISLLFETMLLEGCRPEEACGLKWKVLQENTNELIINNAYKDISIYSAVGKVIGHERRDDRLKTPESYRTLPLNPRLKEILLRHKTRQQRMFKELGIEWSEEQYMFLTKYRKPFVSENLSKNIVKIYKKYSLEHMTAYGLRHSFATFCSENGMEEIVLMRLMGHTDFHTTQKYYISVSKNRKQREMTRVYESINKKILFEQKTATTTS